MLTLHVEPTTRTQLVKTQKIGRLYETRRSVAFLATRQKTQELPVERLSVTVGRIRHSRQPWLSVFRSSFQADCSPHPPTSAVSEKYPKAFQAIQRLGTAPMQNQLNAVCPQGRSELVLHGRSKVWVKVVPQLSYTDHRIPSQASMRE